MSITIPPEILRNRVAGQPHSQSEYLLAGARIAKQIIFDSARFIDVSKVKNILDFGVGSARVMRWLMPMPLFENTNFYGSDYDIEAIDWCKKHVLGATFDKNELLPPLKYSDSAFDLIYCCSVFSHLHEASVRLWLAEFARILVPGGLALVSFHGQTSWNHWISMCGQGQVSALNEQGSIFVKNIGDGVFPDWYQTQFVSQERVRQWVHDDYLLLDHIERGLDLQDFVILKRRSGQSKGFSRESS